MIWLIGSGPMSIEYSKVLKALGKEFIVIGRGENSASEFFNKTGIEVIIGGLEKFLKTSREAPGFSIVATDVEQHHPIAIKLIDRGIKKILLEKPGVLEFSQMEEINNMAIKKNVEVFIGYNRRFYRSVKKAQEIIMHDGGVSSFNFEFTEWRYVIEKLNKNEVVLENWFLANSTHVVDLAFFLGGLPKTISCFSIGALDWHKRSSKFAGAGIAENGALFSYNANWDAPGRWGVEILTKKNKLILRPLEDLFIQEKGSLKIIPVEFDKSMDRKYKPGLMEQVKSFLNMDNSNLCRISDQLKSLKIYNKIAGYN